MMVPGLCWLAGRPARFSLAFPLLGRLAFWTFRVARLAVFQHHRVACVLLGCFVRPWPLRPFDSQMAPARPSSLPPTPAYARAVSNSPSPFTTAHPNPPTRP
ncbi:hypothetical protein BDY21DRAFT_348874 [Lineolata rhizophorae]|uniref:Uncharacterized protein n=1 Tax=Lineolata rhizophorae TaxID=578093 RepID=A0A6A6NVV8_9PEZI|nr:hypothetical protein BDY21DRAFT_348874 [Lineolata rhizophorae]